MTHGEESTIFFVVFSHSKPPLIEDFHGFPSLPRFFGVRGLYQFRHCRHVTSSYLLPWQFSMISLAPSDYLGYFDMSTMNNEEFLNFAEHLYTDTCRRAAILGILPDDSFHPNQSYHHIISYHNVCKTVVPIIYIYMYAEHLYLPSINKKNSDIN